MILQQNYSNLLFTKRELSFILKQLKTETKFYIKISPKIVRTKYNNFLRKAMQQRGGMEGLKLRVLKIKSRLIPIVCQINIWLLW